MAKETLAGKPTDEAILAVAAALNNAEVPMNDRVMYYYKISWWRHPIKRWKQKRKFERILSTDG